MVSEAMGGGGMAGMMGKGKRRGDRILFILNEFSVIFRDQFIQRKGWSLNNMT